MHGRHFDGKSKYKNKSCQCLQNHWHDSIREAHYCNGLEVLKKEGEIKDYQGQVTYRLMVNDQKVCAIIVDFLVTNKYGAQEVHEVKSYITCTPVWNVKRKLFESLYPNIAYIVIK